MLECAHAAGANYLVTGNVRHFPKTFGATKIVTPKQFIDSLLPLLVRFRPIPQRKDLVSGYDALTTAFTTRPTLC